jgi:putative phosphoribosyl transferase
LRVFQQPVRWWIVFIDRKDAGIQLAGRLKRYSEKRGVLVLALPRGGVVTGAEIARRLRIPLDVLIVRKIGHPLQPELAIGAMSETGTVELNQAIIAASGVSKAYIDEEVSVQKREILRRVELYRGGKGIAPLDGKTIILVDDGVATGATLKAAIATLRREKISRLVVAVPVAPPEIAGEVARMADEFICLETPSNFMAVGVHYRDFVQVSDEEVVKLLRQSAASEDKEGTRTSGKAREGKL